MNAAQYDIVKIFLTMGNKAERIAADFGAPLIEVRKVELSANYKQYLSGDLLDRLFGGVI